MNARVGLARRGLQAVVLAVSVAVMSAVSAPAVLASCAPNRSPHDSAARYVITAGAVSGINGLQATISHYDPYYTGVNGTGTNMTIMLLSRRTTDQWAQWGWFKSKLHNGSITRETGYEIFVSGSDNLFQFFGSEPAGSNDYRLLWSSAAQYYYFYRNGSLLDMQPRTFVPNQYQVFGETHDRMDQMPGGSSSRAQFLGTQYRTGTTWTNVNSAIGADPLFGGTHPTAGRYDIWDNGCTF